MKLTIAELKKSFENKDVLKGINFEFEKGKIYGLLGRNGAGKTTLFNCINEDIKKDSGTIKLKDDSGERDVMPNDIGYVRSTPVVPDFLTGREFLKFFIDINKEDINDVKDIDWYFELMKIDEEDRDRLMKDYSLGMKNKLYMLVNIIADPYILLLDEPLTSFDVVVAEEMKEILLNIKKDHITIFSTHIMELALELCDEIVILNNGVLTEVKQEEVDNEMFKDKIISMLKGGEDEQ